MEKKMKVTLSKADINTVVHRSQGAIADKTLAYMGMKTEGNQLHFVIADRIIVVFNTIDCSTEIEGTCFVPARLFSDLVRELPEGVVLLEKKDTFLHVIAGKNQEFRMKLPVVDNKGWQERPQISQENSAAIPSDKLHYLIDQVQFCISTESPRNFGMVGYFHKPESNKLRIVGSDGFRLSYADFFWDIPTGFLNSGITLSKRALTELQKMCSEGFAHVQVAISDDLSTLMASVPHYEIFIRTSAVQYPNYQGVLPKETQASVEVPKLYFQSVAKRVLLAADKSRALQLSFSDSSLTLKARTVGSSEGRESIALEDYKGPNRDLSLNGRYLCDVFSTVTSSKVRLNFKTEEDPFVVIPKEEPEGCHSLHVLVPIRESKQ
jgi:DNA polymerase-3 subunit beta